MKKKHIVFTVINDLNYDQRMQRICNSLVQNGYEVTLIGRQLSHSKPLNKQLFQQKRLHLYFEKGKLFYIEYNIRLFFFLLFSSFDLYGAIDLDTLLPHYLVAKIKRKPFVYDAHEYFSEVPEVTNRPFVKWVWKSIERWVIPRTKYAYTVNKSIVDLFKVQYQTHFEIIRSIAVLRPLPQKKLVQKPTERYILYQGAVNVGRGIEEMITTMQFIDCQLYICGKGDVYEDCVALVESLNLTHKVRFFGFVLPEDLRPITLNATLGFTFFTKQGMSYYLSLANRFFDYFQSGIPQLCVDYPEYRRINKQFEVAVLLQNLEPKQIAQAANQLLENKDLYQNLKQNCLEARQVISWQAEEKKLLQFYQKIFS